MFWFWFVVALLAVALFALWPLVRAARAGLSQALITRSFYQERFDEVAAEAGDAEVRRELEDELGAVMLEELEQRQPGAPLGTARAPLFAFALVLLAGGGVTYLGVADLDVLEVAGAEAVLTMDPADTASLDAWQRRLERRTRAKADDAKSWYLLGHVHLKREAYAAAAQAFASTSQLMPEDLTVKVYWLQTRYLAASGVLDDFGRSLALELIAARPDLPVVLEILALDAFAAARYDEAIRYLHRATNTTADMAQQTVFAAGIREMRKRWGGPAPVTVEVAASANMPPHGTIFVVARPVGGGMPYAVVRRPPLTLPFTVVLDDLVSMSETRLLSQAERFEVAVRLSASGQAMQAPGDWLWVSQALEAAGLPLRLQAQLSPPAE